MGETEMLVSSKRRMEALFQSFDWLESTLVPFLQSGHVGASREMPVSTGTLRLMILHPPVL